MRLQKVLVGGVLAVAVSTFLPTSSASAAESYDGFGEQFVCFASNGRTVVFGENTPVPASPQQAGLSETDPCIMVSVEGRIGRSIRPYDSTAGYGEVEADPDDATHAVSRVQIDKIVLGTQYGVLTTSGARNSGRLSPAYVDLQGPGHRWDSRCSIRYHVAVYWSARLKNGQLKSGKLMSPWYTSPDC